MRELQYEKRDEQSNVWGIAGQASERAGMRDGLTSVGVVEVERLYLSWDKLVVVVTARLDVNVLIWKEQPRRTSTPQPEARIYLYGFDSTLELSQWG